MQELGTPTTSSLLTSGQPSPPPPPLLLPFSDSGVGCTEVTSTLTIPSAVGRFICGFCLSDLVRLSSLSRSRLPNASAANASTEREVWIAWRI